MPHLSFLFVWHLWQQIILKNLIIDFKFVFNKHYFNMIKDLDNLDFKDDGKARAMEMHCSSMEYA